MFKEVEEEYSDLPICILQGVSGQAVLAGLQEGFGPFVVDGCGYTLSPTDLRYRRLASETFKNDTDLLICGELTPGGLFDLCNNVFRFCHCFRLLSRVRTPIMEPKSPTSSVFLHVGKHLNLSPNQKPYPVPFLLTGNKRRT